MKARFRVLLAVLAVPQMAGAASINFTGALRSEASTYLNLGLGVPDSAKAKSFIATRALLQPNLVVDDHFSIKSQWSLLTSPGFTPDGTVPLGVGQGAYVFGDMASKALVLSRAWLEWTSDIGVFRLGRMPVHWGYGVLYDAGEGVWDDFQTTLDRLEYRLHLGYVVGALAYSKPRKLSVQDVRNDADFFAAFLRYDNPESEVEGGVYYERQNRYGQAGDLTGGTAANPYHQGTSSDPLATAISSPLQNNMVDLYLRKTTGVFTYGGEVCWISGIGVSSTAQSTDLNAWSILANLTATYHKFKSSLEVLYAMGDANMADGSDTGFTLLNRNRRPGLILGRELLGHYLGENVALGTPLAYGANGSFSGVLYFRPAIRVDWSSTLTSTAEAVYARKATVQSGEPANLGVEIDLGTDYALYKNFRLGVDAGLLVGGTGIVPDIAKPGLAYAIRTTAILTF